MKKLSKKITLDELMEGSVKLATNVAEEAVTRTLVAVSKNKGKIVSTAKWGLGYFALGVIDDKVDNFVGDMILDGAQLTTGLVTAGKAYGTVKSIANDYCNATDSEAEEIRELMGLEPKDKENK